MKTGDTIKVRLVGSQTWSNGKVVLVSENGRSIAVSGDDLPSSSRGFTVHPELGKCMLLLREEGRLVYDDIFTGNQFEISGIDNFAATTN